MYVNLDNKTKIARTRVLNYFQSKTNAIDLKNMN